MTQQFNDSLDKTTDLFSKSKYTFHTIKTKDGILTRFDKVNRKEELIIRVCKELEDQLKETLVDTDEIYYLGISFVQLSITESKDDNDSDRDVNSKNVECDIWEKINDKEFEKLENNS